MGPHGPFELKIGMTGHYWMKITKMKVPSEIDRWGEGVVVTSSKIIKFPYAMHSLYRTTYGLLAHMYIPYYT